MPLRWVPHVILLLKYSWGIDRGKCLNKVTHNIVRMKIRERETRRDEERFGSLLSMMVPPQ
jgi:hypothetical protein